MDSSLYDAIYSGVAGSSTYRAVLADTAFALPDWVVPLSSIDRLSLQRIAEEIAVSDGEHFADLACGLGGLGLWVARSTNACVTGVDYSPVAIGEARRLAANRGMESRATFVVADVTSTGLAASSCDAVMSVDALQFVDAAAAMSEIARILKLTFYQAMLRRADDLRAEMHEAAEPLLDEAEAGLRREREAPRVRKVLIVAKKAW